MVALKFFAISAFAIFAGRLPGYADLHACARGALWGCNAGACWSTVASELGCTTTTCLCAPSHLGAALDYVYSTAQTDCLNMSDAGDARAILQMYCANHKFTSIESPTVLNQQRLRKERERER
ncbi:hypothetical protein BKA62DRAFT_729463 [Auriculariales sp. MPI-PUGE-AT-0066]|nr:hypothetical protein BKA62DRAFT_729463 [Auriculariales sp. MPI-PUGE-AT-0066]